MLISCSKAVIFGVAVGGPHVGIYAMASVSLVFSAINLFMEGHAEKSEVSENDRFGLEWFVASLIPFLFGIYAILFIALPYGLFYLIRGIVRSSKVAPVNS